MMKNEKKVENFFLTVKTAVKGSLVILSELVILTASIYVYILFATQPRKV
jgi:hypothetical protein